MYNKIIIMGNLGKDPDVRLTNSGQKVASLSVATSETYKDQNGQKKTVTQWHKVVCWQHLADISESFLKKGSQVLIDGKLVYRSYDDKSGNRRSISEIKAVNLIMLGKSSNTQQGQPSTSEPSLSKRFQAKTQQNHQGVEPDPHYPNHPGPGGAGVHPNDNNNYLPPDDEDLPF